MRKLLSIVSVCLVFVLSGCGGDSDDSKDAVDSGDPTEVSDAGQSVEASVLILQNQGVTFDGNTCTGAESKSSVKEGAKVIVHLEDGEKESKLGAGVRTPEGNCQFDFELSDVPVGTFRAQIGDVMAQGEVTEHPDDGRLWVTFGFRN